MPSLFDRLPKLYMPRRKHLLTLSAALLVGALLVPSANAANVTIDVRTPEDFKSGILMAQSIFRITKLPAKSPVKV
ncbi:Uncharacterised protein [Moraxella atlantae]|uniref:Uncharacterized protein n=1 Tax=Faucicola atlantae TaxID=34059 RepID=A0A378QN93_9GAMM|nr:hypothetical protein [Moraxella atlantae]STZ01774.1 Uncharacterised protein [Moraxella atlantae]